MVLFGGMWNRPSTDPRDTIIIDHQLTSCATPS